MNSVCQLQSVLNFQESICFHFSIFVYFQHPSPPVSSKTVDDLDALAADTSSAGMDPITVFMLWSGWKYSAIQVVLDNGFI